MTPLIIKPGQYEVRWTEERSCIGYVNITADHAEAAGQNVTKAAKLVLETSDPKPHDVEILSDEIEEVFEPQFEDT